MTPPLGQSELLLIRHAPSLADGRLCGRQDVAADLDAAPGLDVLKRALCDVPRLMTSTAKRCRQTAAALWPDRPPPEVDKRLWEQDFGDWDGMAYADIPDLGDLDRDALAKHCPPNGESFAAMCDRALGALREQASTDAGPIAIVAHAGTVRAGLSLALGNRADALAFEIAPLSVTRLRYLGGDAFSIIAVNWIAS